MNRNLIILAGVATILAIVAVSTRPNPTPQETPEPIQPKESVHFHAGFQIYKDNVLVDFTDFKYMNFTPCSEHEEELSPEEEQIEKAHLHDFAGDVVHVHRENATWGDLFKNLNYELSPDEVYINGELLAENLLNYPIKAYDSIVVFIGENTDKEEKLEKKVTKERIEEVEKKSEYCAS